MNLLIELSLLWCYYFQELWPDFDSWYFVDTGSLLASFNLKPFEKTNQFSQSDLNFILTSGVVHVKDSSNLSTQLQGVKLFFLVSFKA